MNFREDYIASRRRYLESYDAEEASKYDMWITSLTREDHIACLKDLSRCFRFSTGMTVLDAGAGTGALCLTLTLVQGLQITALEPCPAMLELLRAKPQLNDIATICGFCDHPDDKSHFTAGQFDVIASRQLVNCLFDPLAAFQNWHHWLCPNGKIIVMDGLFDRSDWSGRWGDLIDTLPLSACRTMATVPYLLEQSGFTVEFAGMMDAINQLPSTRTKRYMVLAAKTVG